MRDFKVEHELGRKIKRLFKRDKQLCLALKNKMRQVLDDADVKHYKNLRSPLNRFKRVHVKNFVLLFKYDAEKDAVSFHDFKHNDEVYK